jgi:predicted transcriptional regulator
VTANLEKRLRKSLGNEALEKRITELEAQVAALVAWYEDCQQGEAKIIEMQSEPRKRGRPKKPKPE